MKKIVIIGYGYVGQAMFNFFKDHYEVCFYNPDKKGTVTKEEANKCDLGVVCVPTPVAEDSSCDTSIVEETLDWLETPLILIKSTIPPGTCGKLRNKTGKNIVFSPEYIGEGLYWVNPYKYPHPTDMKYHDFYIFGGYPKDTEECVQYFIKVAGPDKKYLVTGWIVAELVKYMENSWGALKVTFFNEMYDIAETFNISYTKLRELFLLDGRTERMHTAVFKDKRGYGGKCFPKDVKAIIRACERANYKPELLKSVDKVNDKFNKLNG